MTLYRRYKHASIALHDVDACSYLTPLIQSSTSVEQPDQVDLELSYETNGLHLKWFRGARKPLAYHLDFAKTTKQHRSFPVPKQGAFNQALGKKSRTVLDATGGWGADAFLMCLQGYQVTVLERDALMVAILGDAFSRLSANPGVEKSNVVVPRVVYEDAVTTLNSDNYPADCVYLDPMFPPKKKKSAAANKYMQLLQWLIGEQADAIQLAESAANAGYQRIVVKRPDHAASLLPDPHARFSSKLVHYDVYLNNSAKD